MVTDYLTIYTVTNKVSTLKIRITKDGKYIEQHEFTKCKRVRYWVGCPSFRKRKICYGDLYEW